MNERKMYRLSVDMADKCVTEDSKVRIYLSEVRSETKETASEKIIVGCLKFFYSGAVAAMIGQWAIAAAYAERGYKAYGGEYLLIGMTFLISYHLIDKFFKGYRRQK